VQHIACTDRIPRHPGIYTLNLAFLSGQKFGLEDIAGMCILQYIEKHLLYIQVGFCYGLNLKFFFLDPPPGKNESF